jgi:hypothetical protein
MSFVKLLEHDGDLTVVYELKDKPLVDKFVSKYNWPRPIPVSERLPECRRYPNETRVLAYVPKQNGKYGDWYKAIFDDHEVWWFDWPDIEEMPDPTHWLPTPPPPE